jgi:hypothetical protein
LRGPHAGLPEVCELPADAIPPAPSPAKKKPISRAKPKAAHKLPLKSGLIVKSHLENIPPTPAYIPLPLSRSSSPLSSSDSLSIGSESLLPIPGQPIVSCQSLSAAVRNHRSPKRSFDESSGSSASEGNRTPLSQVDDMGDSTPDLSTPGSPAESTRSSSAASSPLPSTPPAFNTPPPEPEKRLTRRQRKALGLPKSRSAQISAGKITIPGGQFKKATTTSTSKAKEDEEWQRNGTGRLDVRGFRELKI